MWGAFYGTSLDLELRRRGITQIVLCGVATSIGVETTARNAYERGYNVSLAIDAMTDINGEATRIALHASSRVSARPVPPTRYSLFSRKS